MPTRVETTSAFVRRPTAIGRKGPYQAGHTNNYLVKRVSVPQKSNWLEILHSIQQVSPTYVYHVHTALRVYKVQSIDSSLRLNQLDTRLVHSKSLRVRVPVDTSKPRESFSAPILKRMVFQSDVQAAISGCRGELLESGAPTPDSCNETWHHDEPQAQRVEQRLS